jgi:predicted nucleic acid-binding protein
VRVLVDTNVVLDVLLDRKPFAEAATQVFALVEESKIEGFLCATTVTTIDYLLAQALVPAKAREALHRLLNLFEIAPVNRPVLEQALGNKGSVRTYRHYGFDKGPRVIRGQSEHIVMVIRGQSEHIVIMGLTKGQWSG